MRTLRFFDRGGINFVEINLFWGLFLRKNPCGTSTSWFWSSIRSLAEDFGSHSRFERARAGRLLWRIIFDDVRTLLKYFLFGFRDWPRTIFFVFYKVVDPYINMLLEVRPWDVPPAHRQLIDIGLIALPFFRNDLLSSSASHHIFYIHRRHCNNSRPLCSHILFFLSITRLVAQVNIQLFFQDI